MARRTATIPPVPAGFNKDELFGQTYWHQKWQVFQGLYTPGHNSIADMCEAFGLPTDLSGHRVLDIGAWNGCLSFECERRGAKEVIALGPEPPENTGFYRLAKAVHSTRTHYLLGTIYNLDPQKLGHFDTVLCCGVLYHLRYPMLGIDNLRRVCAGDLYVETLISDDYLQSTLSDPALKIPLWHFYRFNEVNNDYSNWFGPNSTAVVQALESAGFQIDLTAQFKGGGRAVFRGKVKQGVPEFLTLQTGEGVYYDLLVKHLLGKKKPGEQGRPLWPRLRTKMRGWLRKAG